MSLTSTQKTLLNGLRDHIPAMKRGALAAADQIKLGDLLDFAIASADAAAVATADAAGGSYGAEEETLLNEVKATVNQLVTLANEIKAALNATVS